jgi:hypothetical protein
VLLIFLIATSASLVARAEASPPIIDGTRDPAYGAPLVAQTTQTQYDDTLARVGDANGWELDEAYGFISNDVLYLMLTGNLSLEPNPVEPGTFSSPIHLFIDSQSGGQNTLRSDNEPYGLLGDLSGLTFDTDFTPDFWLGCAGSGGPDFSTPYELGGEFATLPSSAAASVTFLGFAQVGGQHAFTGGSNPYGIAVGLDNSNNGGVSQGCGASSGPGVATGFECAIPLAAIGSPTGSFKVCALYEPWFHGVSNQVLGPLPPGTCGLGAASGVNFATIPGNQYFVVSPATNVVPRTAPLGLWLAPRINPSAAMSVTFTLPLAAPARLEVVDASGRRVMARSLDGVAAGPHTLDLARDGELPAGIYFVRLSQGARMVSARSVILR